MINMPRTTREARIFWRGQYDHRSCAGEVEGGTWDGSQCNSPRGHGPFKLYCKHHAKMIAKREEETCSDF